MNLKMVCPHRDVKLLLLQASSKAGGRLENECRPRGKKASTGKLIAFQTV